MGGDIKALRYLVQLIAAHRQLWIAYTFFLPVVPIILFFHGNVELFNIPPLNSTTKVYTGFGWFPLAWYCWKIVVWE